MATNQKGDANKHRKNFVNITLQVGKDGEGKYTQSGKPFAQARAFYSQGKVKDSEEYLPSIWFNVKAFGKDGEEITANPLVNTLATAAKGDKIEVRGRLGYEEWVNGDGETRSTLTIYASEAKLAETSDAQAEDEPQP